MMSASQKPNIGAVDEDRPSDTSKPWEQGNQVVFRLPNPTSYDYALRLSG
jgi:hypothetical protein